MKEANEQEGEKRRGEERTGIIKAWRYKGNTTNTNGMFLQGSSEKTNRDGNGGGEFHCDGGAIIIMDRNKKTTGMRKHRFIRLAGFLAE